MKLQLVLVLVCTALVQASRIGVNNGHSKPYKLGVQDPFAYSGYFEVNQTTGASLYAIHTSEGSTKSQTSF